MDLLAGNVDAGVLEVGGGAGVGDHRHGETEIHGSPHGGVDAHRGHDSADDQLIDPVVAQPLLETGAHERVRRLLDYDRLVAGRRDAIVGLPTRGWRPPGK